MSLDRYLAGCKGKDAFDSFARALDTVSLRLRKLVRPYHCPTCGQYHVGSVEHTRGKRLSRKKREDHDGND